MRNDLTSVRMASNLVYALDFDGVVCDSVGESSISGVKAAARAWPNELALQNAAASPQHWLLDSMRAVRPVVETGFENVLLARHLVEAGQDTCNQLVEIILEDWHERRVRLLEQWNVDRDTLITLFGTIRDEWIHEDEQSWLSANRLYVFFCLPFSYILPFAEERESKAEILRYIDALLCTKMFRTNVLSNISDIIYWSSNVCNLWCVSVTVILALRMR